MRNLTPPQNVKLIEIESRMVVVRSWGGVGVGNGEMWVKQYKLPVIRAVSPNLTYGTAAWLLLMTPSSPRREPTGNGGTT